jgi:transposase InsO family protein
MRGLKFSPKEKEKALKMWLVEKKDIFYVCKKNRCTERSLWRWKAQYNGTLESLTNRSSRPITPNKLSHTAEERAAIVAIFTEHPDISYTEALGILRTKYAYKRTYGGFYRYVVKNHLRPVKQTEKYIPQPYETPEHIGVKWQMDVKYVPRACNHGKFAKEWIYQYTMIDEATRERFLFPYKEKSGYSTVDFVKRAIVYFGYAPQTIQTDNGTEFTNPKGTGEGKKHALDILLDRLGIRHQLIRVYTPRHNGKVERSHRTDSEFFYKTLTFETYEELKEKMAAWVVRYNNRPHSALRNKEGKRVWLTPLQKREQLIEQLHENADAPRIRFIKNK